jgi:hypothetical protein
MGFDVDGGKHQDDGKREQGPKYLASFIERQQQDDHGGAYVGTRKGAGWIFALLLDESDQPAKQVAIGHFHVFWGEEELRPNHRKHVVDAVKQKDGKHQNKNDPIELLFFVEPKPEWYSKKKDVQAEIAEIHHLAEPSLRKKLGKKQGGLASEKAFVHIKEEQVFVFEQDVREIKGFRIPVA